MRKSTITSETMKKVWRLHNNSVDNNLIAETLGLSSVSVQRIINILTTAQNGGDIDAIYPNLYKTQKTAAREMFGLREEQKKQTELNREQAKNNSDDDNTRLFVVRVIHALDYQNKLL